MKAALEERLSRFTQAWERARKRSLRLGWIRVGTFLAGAAAYVAADVTEGTVSRLWWGGLGLVLLIFLVEVVWHRRIRAEELRFGTLVQVNKDALSRMARRWEALPAAGYEPPPELHPYALDLDLSGPGSLFSLLTTVTLPPGKRTLRSWLLASADPEEILLRQGGVEELAAMLDLRQTIEVAGRMVDPPSPKAMEGFLSWAEEKPWLPGHPWIRAGAWALPVLTLSLAYLHFWGPLQSPWWMFTLTAAFALASVHRGAIHRLLDAASGGQEGFERYAAVLEILDGMEAKSPAMTALQEAVRSSSLAAPQELRRLGRAVGWADVRLSAMAHGILQMLFVWDIHVLGALEGWKRGAGPHVREWLEALGRFEALAALGALKGENPEWAFPDLPQEGKGGLRATQLGHPLLPPGDCVRNEVEIGPPGSFLFLTGSNMSGKSTLLRAVGLNVVLANAGGPVCASAMTLSPLKVHTSMRTSDSLTQGVSQYMAELHGIQRVVEGARAGENVLYLLDEPLQGTNEAERRVAVQTILGHLLKAGSVGGVATHDLSLDETEGLREASRPFHLEGQVGDGEKDPLLSFDYKLRSGRATSTNALALLRAVGLGENT
jgi:hypothetical protein